MIKNLLEQDEEPRAEEKPASSSVITSLFDESVTSASDAPLGLSETEPQSMAETVRQSGLAYSAGIVLFASVAFMLVIGWGADLLFGSSPWGIVLGIVLGALIGFVQFFRLTSQIFRK